SKPAVPRAGLQSLARPAEMVRHPARRLEWFLILWLGLEVAGYFALTPFPAVRRVMGIIVAGTMLAGFLAARTCRSPERKPFVRFAAAYGIALGFLFYGVDLRDAFAAKEAAERAAFAVRELEPDASIWYVGHWGFQHYAERAGMKPVVPDQSLLRRGEWLVGPDYRHNQQMIRRDVEELALMQEIAIEDPLPLRTIMPYYGGDIPLEHHQGPRMLVQIYRVRKDFVPSYRQR